MTYVIETEGLGKKYRHVQALDDVSFEVPEGAIYGLLGPNGSGKTTLLDMLVNLQTPTAGKASVLGFDSRRLQGKGFAAIGYVSENQEFPVWMTVRQLLDYLKPFYSRWDDERAGILLEQFRLPADRKLRHLSRGMRMKVALASCLSAHPRLLILDEPFSGLDPLTRDELIEALLEGASETTVLMSSHDLAEIESFVTHIAYLEAGRLIFAEESATLSARFREITITLDRAVRPDPWPSHWLCADEGAGSLRFVDSRFDAEQTPREIRVHFDGVREIEASSMTLRSIFLALARTQLRVS